MFGVTQRSRTVGVWRARRQLGIAAVTMVLVASCAPSSAKAGAPYRACGQMIANPAGAPVRDFVPGAALASGPAVIQLVTSCSVGDQVAFEPPGAASILNSIRTKDGAYRAVEIALGGRVGVSGAGGSLVVSQSGRRLGQMTLYLPASPSAGSSAH